MSKKYIECGVCKTENKNDERYCTKCGQWLLSDIVVSKTVTRNKSKAFLKSCFKFFMWIFGILFILMLFFSKNTTNNKKIAVFDKNKCEQITFEEIARFPDANNNKYVKFIGSVVQIMENDGQLQMRVNITKVNDSFYKDTIYVICKTKDVEKRILENDIITVYGISGGLITYKTIFNVPTTIPRIDAYCILFK